MKHLFSGPRVVLAGLGLASLVACGSSQPSGTGASGAGAGGAGSTGTDSTTSSTGSTGTGTGTGAGGQGGAAGCPTCGEPASVGTVASSQLTEASGLVASATHPGSFYAHNDSGDEARFFGVGPAGEDRGTFVLDGVSANDWEDMARGPCAGAGSCLYFADIGDNDRQRDEYVIHRVTEPATLAPGEVDVTAESFRFVYPDGAHNAEALAVHPTTGAITIVTKDARLTQAFELPLPLDAGSVATATLVGTATVPDLLPLVTGADVAPDASAVLLRTYTSVWRYPLASGQRVGEALAATPCSMPAPIEDQGETVAFALDGASYRTLSEGDAQPFFRVTCP